MFLIFSTREDFVIPEPNFPANPNEFVGRHPQI
jgi:hypothetical protein